MDTEEKSMVDPISTEEVEKSIGIKKSRKHYKPLKERKSARKTATEENPEGREKHILTKKRIQALEKARVKLREKREQQKMEKEKMALHGNNPTPKEEEKKEVHAKHVDTIKHQAKEMSLSSHQEEYKEKPRRSW